MAAPSPAPLAVPFRHRLPGSRLWVVLGILLAGVWAAVELRLDVGDLIPGSGGWSLAQEFLSHGLQPAWTYESDDLPAVIQPLPVKALDAALVTVSVAVAATSLSVVVGLLLSFAAATAPWGLETSPPATSRRRWRRLGPWIYGVARGGIALMRSIHELLWAVLLLAAFGIGQLSAVIAIAIPYSGTLAKVFSEILDEAPREAAQALEATGASALQVFFFGLLPGALPDMASYAFYRFECALRSSAVLGFFGFPTLGYYIAAAFENLHFGEVWTYLYTLLILIAVADLWSGTLRRRWAR